MATISQSREDLETLEGLIDRYDLGDVINGLFHICHEKAEHLRSTWQDEQAAKAWERDATKLGKIEDKIEN